MQRDLPFALQMTATYSGTKGTHGPQEILPNSYPLGAANPCPGCPSGFVYETSNGNSIRQAGQLQLRRRLRGGFAASLAYTYSKSIDDDAYLGGQGHTTASSGGQAQSASLSTPSAAVAQNWLDPRAERSLSTFDQRHLLSVQAQYTSGQGLEGGTLLGGWRGRALKEWTVLSTFTLGSGLPETPLYPAAVPGTGFTNIIRPDLTGTSIYTTSGGSHLNAAAYSAPAAGQWGTAGRDSIIGPDQLTLNSSLARTFRPHGKLYLDFAIGFDEHAQSRRLFQLEQPRNQHAIRIACCTQCDAQPGNNCAFEVPMMRIPGVLLLFFLAVSGSRPQQIGQNKGAGETQSFTLTVQSNLVVEAVEVKDKQGNFIHGLTAKDFVLTEDGAPQTIRYCEHEDLAATAQPLPAETPANENVTIYNRLAHEQIAPESIENERYKNRRLMALYFDMTALPPSDEMRALSAAEQFVRTQMTTVDLVSILRYQGGSVDILQDFTADRNRLLSILETMVVGEGQGSADTVDDASSADTGAAFGQDDSEFNVFNTDRQLSALQTAARMLGQVNEKKTLIYFASGLRLQGIDNQAQMHATADTAIKAGVTIWTVDARGLVAQAPLGDATQGSPGNQGVYTGAAAQAVTSNFQQSQDTLYALAGDTGGKAFLDNNDLTRGIVQAQQAISDYYILAYYTTNTEPERQIPAHQNFSGTKSGGQARLSPGLLCR